MSERLVVIGGGVVGLSTALYAQSRGLSVTIMERTSLGSGASGHNGGIFSLGNCLPTSTPEVIRKLPGMLLDPLSPLAIRWTYLPRLSPWLLRFFLSGRKGRVEEISVALSEMLALSLDAYGPLLPPDAISPSPGHLIGFASEKGFESSSFGLDVRRRRGISLRELAPSEIAELDPALEGKFARGVLVEGAPYVTEPAQTMKVLADRFERAGGTLLIDEVVGFDKSGDSVTAAVGRVHRVEAELFVLAGGAWSKRLAADLGARVPLDTERGYGVHLPDSAVKLRVPLIYAEHHLALTPAGDGALRIVGTDELAGVDAAPDYRRADKLIEATRLIFPELNASGAERWLSFRPSMPDSLPVIGRSPELGNAYLAFGHGHIGFTTGALTGRLVTQAMLGSPTDIDLTPFSPSRF